MSTETKPTDAAEIERLRFEKRELLTMLGATGGESVAAAARRYIDAEMERRAARPETGHLAEFKAYVHQRLDEAGVPTHPNGPHSAQGCRVGDPLDIALAKAPSLHLPAQMGELRERLEKLRADVAATKRRDMPFMKSLIDQGLNEILRLVPVEHDDQQGGKPVRP